MTFSMTMAAVALVMWVICLGLAPAWMGASARSRGPSLRSRLAHFSSKRSRLRPKPSFSVMV